MKNEIAELFEAIPQRSAQGPYEPTVLALIDAVLAETDHGRVKELALDLACIARRQMLASSEPRCYALNKQAEIGPEGLSVQTYNLLRGAGIVTLGDLARFTTDTLLAIRCFGRRNLEELNKVVAQYGLYFDLRLSTVA